MAYPQSYYAHIVDFGSPKNLKQLAIQVPYPMTITINNNQEVEIGSTCIYEVFNIQGVQTISIGADSAERALITYLET